jgi:sialic acid synthase SpsE
MTLDVDRPEYFIQGGLWASEKLFDLYRRAETPWSWTAELQLAAKAQGMTLFSSPFDSTAVAFLETLDMPAYKIASFELTDLPLLRCVGATQKPVIISTGMARKSEIEAAIETLEASGCPSLAVLKCTSAYPAPIEEQNLSLIPRMMSDFHVPIGFSDHTLGSSAAVAAVALGATIVEKHVQVPRSAASPDAGFSMGADELTQFIQDIHEAYTLRGSGNYGPTPSEEPLLRLRRSVIANRDLDAGVLLTESDFVVRRPNIGAPPSVAREFTGRRLLKTLKRGEGMTLNDLE